VEHDNQIIGVAGFSDVSEETVHNLRCCYCLDQAVSNTAFHNFSSIEVFVINPVFQFYKRKILQVCQTLQGATACFLHCKIRDLGDKDYVCPIYKDMVQIPPRHEPILVCNGSYTSKASSKVNFAKAHPKLSVQEAGDIERDSLVAEYKNYGLSLVT